VRFQVLTAASMMFRIVFWDVLPCKMMEAVRTSETSVENHFTRQYIPEDNSKQNLILVFKEICFDFQMGDNCEKVALAFLILAGISSSELPLLDIILPRYTNYFTSYIPSSPSCNLCQLCYDV
jgi:hypothetical protein